MWGVDQLDSHTTLSPGESVEVLLPVTNGETCYDVRAVDEDEDTYMFFVNIDAKRDNHVFQIENNDLD